jgi:small subunit ribosomal protein S1
MDWTNKNIHPTKVVNLGDEVEVMILEVDESKRRLSLGIKQCKENPWQAFENDHKQGETIKGSIKSITDFGIFIGLDGGIDGLIHLSDISATASNEEAVKKYKKGDEVEAKILAIDVDKERISLGIKQLSDDYTEEAIDDGSSSGKKETKKAKTSVEKEPENAGTTNLGALLKAKMSDATDKE